MAIRTQTVNYDLLHMHPVRRILIIKLRAIGDVLLSTIVLHNLRAAFPDAQIDFLTEKASQEIIQNNPYLTNTIIFHPKKDNILRTFRNLYHTKYDLVFDLFCNPRSAQMTFATRAPYRVGYPFRGRGYAYNIKITSRADKIHNALFNLDPLITLDIPIIDKSVQLYLQDTAHAWAKKFISSFKEENSLLIALNPSGTWQTKRWGLDHFAQLADVLIQKYNAQILLIWGPGEKEDVLKIQSMMQRSAIIADETSLQELSAILSECDFMLSNDSGPMHIAAIMNVPTLGIFGPTNPYAQGPYSSKALWVREDSLDCLGCNLTKCKIGNLCMKNLTVEKVLDSFDILYNNMRDKA